MSPQELATEYFTYRTSFRRLATKYDIPIGRVQRAVNELKEESKRESEKYGVIKIPEKWIEGISHLLEARGIPHEIPENFELIEKYESKLNY